jgi:hypothetical protein
MIFNTIAYFINIIHLYTFICLYHEKSKIDGRERSYKQVKNRWELNKEVKTEKLYLTQHDIDSIIFKNPE